MGPAEIDARRWRVLLWGLPLAFATLAACGPSEQIVDEPPLRPVRIIEVATEVGDRQRSFSGSSRSTQESRLSFKVGGNVVALPIQVGDPLQPGQLIAALDRSTFDLKVQQSQANLVQAQANERNAEAGYNRVRGLYENANASRNDLDVARAGAESARAQVRAAQKMLEIDKLNRSYTQLAASAACTVASVNVELNENVSAGAQIATVNCGREIEVSLGIPESLIAMVTQGMPATVRFNVLPGREFLGQVTEVGQASGSTTATFPVTVAIVEKDPALRPGMAAEVMLRFQSERDGRAHVLPAAAVSSDALGTFVFIAERAGNDAATALIRRREVVVGELLESGLEVIEGLSDGDLVVTAGVSVIRDGQTVLLPES